MNFELDMVDNVKRYSTSARAVDVKGMLRGGRNESWLAVLLVGCIVAACARYPSRANIDQEIARYQSVSDVEVRRRIMFNLLEKLQRTTSTEDDAILRYGLQSVRALYLRKPDVAVLEALDELRLEGGFANEVCELYQALVVEETAKEWYRQHGVSPLKRCVGLSFRTGELEQVLAPPK